MIQILHNNRCSKSREALNLLQEKGIKHVIRYYLENPLSEKEIEDLLKKLKLSPIEIVRNNEAIWKENFKGKDFSDQELIKILGKNPKLIERPILINNDAAIVGRPIEKVQSFLHDYS